MHVVAERGYQRTTMQHVARRAGASKETLYSWFGGKEGLLAAVVSTNAQAAAERVGHVLAVARTPTAESARRTLTAYAAAQLTLLTGRDSVVLNRAAMSSPTLAEVLLREGRHRVGPIVARYLRELHEREIIDAQDPEAAFQLLYGLVVRDVQIRVLLGEPAPGPARIRADAEQAVDRFFQLAGVVS